MREEVSVQSAESFPASSETNSTEADHGDADFIFSRRLSEIKSDVEHSTVWIGGKT